MDINLDRVLGRLEELYQCGRRNIHPHGIFAGGQEGTGDLHGLFPEAGNRT